MRIGQLSTQLRIYWTQEVKVLCNEAYLSVKPYLKNRSKDFIIFLHNDREEYYEKTHEAQFLKKILNPAL